MSDYPMLISNKLHSFRNFELQRYVIIFKLQRVNCKLFLCQYYFFECFPPGEVRQVMVLSN